MIPPAVYMAGPVDYIEHRGPTHHRIDNWRHRLFGMMDIELLCPTCLNVESQTPYEIMDTNRRAIERADVLVAYFPGDVATFGTPIEVWEWCHRHREQGTRGVLIHPAPEGVFVTYLREVYGLTVVGEFDEAKLWLRRLLTAP